MVLISQDKLKAIDIDKIAFYYIPKNTENDSDGVKYSLYAKTPFINGEFYDLIRLFRHKNLNVVKNVMRFLANGQFLIPYADGNKNILVVDLPELYKHGMKTEDFYSKGADT